MTHSPWVPLLSVLACLLGASAPAPAQEKFGDRRTIVTIRSEAVPLDDVEGHVLVLYKVKGLDRTVNRIAHDRGVADLVKGTGTSRGYGTAIDPDGDKIF